MRSAQAPRPEPGAHWVATTAVKLATRVAAVGDLAELVALYRRFREDVASERGADVHLSREAFVEPLEALMDTIVRDQGRLALLGLLGEVPVGIAIGRIEELADSSRLAIVEVLYVDEPAREVGVGECLLASLVEWAGANGADGIDVQVLPGMRQAKNFLEGSRFAARLLVMHRNLKR